PMSDNGKYFWLKLIKVCENDVLEMNSGLAFNPSTNAAIVYIHITDYPQKILVLSFYKSH
ncbi:hypothetical protein GQX38_01685, partial [Staphylococcus aureus]|nr:hypothetical protein [Staphylococcus aureus]